MTNPDSRPPVWVGHIVMKTNQLDASKDFMIKIGMRPIFRGENTAILELRGGTHIVLDAEADFTPGPVDFDLMVEDITSTHDDFKRKGLDPSPIQEGRVHQSFKLTEPGGNTILFNSNHVSDQPV
jgi:hypothetical protein